MTILKACFKSYLFSFFMLYAYVSRAQQISIVPLENNPVILEHLERHPVSNARNNQICPIDTLALPFFDDFAGGTIYPNCNHWEDNHVFINDAMAHNPPSVGVATFDGLAPNGAPYNKNANSGFSLPADTLTSQAIDLAGKTLGDAIYLSFFYQKQGLSDRPELQDSLILEFKDVNGNWRTVWEEPGVDNSVSSATILPFEQQYIAVDSAYYMYKGFQFRFRNLASISGNNDHWHLDYILLDENRTNNADTLHPTYGHYADVAFTHRPSTPLKNNLMAMPWRHFDAANSWSTEFVIQNYNHNHSQVATLDRTCVIEEIEPTTTNLLTEGIPAVGAYGPSPNNNDSIGHTIVGAHANFNPSEKTVLETTYTIVNPSGFQSNPMFEPNDTTRLQNVLDNYFAYDDGTAETRIIAQGVGTKIAVEYQTEVEDTLQGIYFHMPYFIKDSEQDFINVKVWIDSLSDQSEVFSLDLHHLRYRWGFNGFYFVDLVDFNGDKILVPLRAGQKFYVGWQQSFGTEVPVGFDRSTDNKDKTWVGVGSTWTQSTVSGSVMIRPLLWPNEHYNLIPVETIEGEEEQSLSVFPNPTEGILNLALENETNTVDYTIQIHNTLGQQIYVGSFSRQLDLRNQNKGLYVLTLIDGQGKQIAQHKIIKH